MRRRGVLPPHGDGEGREDTVSERQDTKTREPERGSEARRRPG